MGDASGGVFRSPRPRGLMSKSDGLKNPARKAVALQYGPDDAAPVIVASGMGYMAEKIVETAADNAGEAVASTSTMTKSPRLRSTVHSRVGAPVMLRSLIFSWQGTQRQCQSLTV